MADLVPHPLVTRVGLHVAGQGLLAFPEDVEDPTVALKPPEAPATTGRRRKPPKSAKPAESPESPEPAPSVADPIDDDSDRAEAKNVLATALANQANVPALSLFAGYLGGPVERDGKRWRLLYLDSRLSSWLLVPQEAIVVHERLEDDHAPSRLRDVLWVDGTAMVVHGEGARSNEGRFLVGEFTRAGDFAASTTGGTFSAATGLLCEATTPGCCFGNRTRR